MKPRSDPRTRATLACLAAALLASLPVQTAGQITWFSDGVWLGNAVALGPIDAPDGTWNGRIDGWFDLFVDQGTVQGTVMISAAGVANISSTPPGILKQNGSGQGTATGDATGFEFNGSIAVAHRAITTHPGMGRVIVPGANTEPLRIQVKITAATCTDVEGEWIQDWNVMARQRSYTTQLHGTFAAVRQDEAALADLRDWSRRVTAWTDGGLMGGPPQPPPAGSMGQLPSDIQNFMRAYIASLTTLYSMTSSNPFSSQSVRPALVQLFTAKTLVDQLSECSRQLLGDDEVTPYLKVVAGNTGLIASKWSDPRGLFDRPMTGRDVRMIAGYGDSNGAWDQQLNSDAAFDAESLRQAAEKLLESYVTELYSNVPGIQITDNFDSRQLVDAAGYMSWTFTYGQYDYRASELRASIR